MVGLYHTLSLNVLFPERRIFKISASLSELFFFQIMDLEGKNNIKASEITGYHTHGLFLWAYVKKH